MKGEGGENGKSQRQEAEAQQPEAEEKKPEPGNTREDWEAESQEIKAKNQDAIWLPQCRPGAQN